MYWGGEEFYNYTISDEVQWNHKTFVEAGTLLKQIMDQGYLVDGFLGMSPSEGFELFNNGDVAMSRRTPTTMILISFSCLPITRITTV